MLSCKDATRLVSEKLDRELPLWQRLSLRMHVFLCRGCSRYAHQIESLEEVVTEHYRVEGLEEAVTEHYREAQPTGPLAELPSDAMERIKASLRRSVSESNSSPTE